MNEMPSFIEKGIAVFQKVMALAANYGLRIVGINRRDYPGSTPFSHSELAVLSGGSDDERADFVRARGLEIATFVDRFIENQGVPPISEDGKSGGIALLGWSLGSAFVLSTISCCDTWPTELQSRLKTHLRALILQCADVHPYSISPPTFRQNLPPLPLGPHYRRRPGHPRLTQLSKNLIGIHCSLSGLHHTSTMAIYPSATPTSSPT